MGENIIKEYVRKCPTQEKNSLKPPQPIRTLSKILHPCSRCVLVPILPIIHLNCSTCWVVCFWLHIPHYFSCPSLFVTFDSCSWYQPSVITYLLNDTAHPKKFGFFTCLVVVNARQILNPFANKHFKF